MQLCRLFLYLVLLRGSDSQCHGEEGKGQNCCNGYRWDYTKKKCIKCTVGFFGYDCSKRCRYPNYGENCQFYCTCTRTLCDPADGCSTQGFTGKTAIFYSVTEASQNTTHTTNDATPKPNSTQNQNINFIILVVILGLTVIIFPAVFTAYKVTKLRMRMLQYEQQRGNNGKPTVFRLRDFDFAIHTDSAERATIGDQNHDYEEISPAMSHNSSAGSRIYIPIISKESDKEDEEYLTPVQIQP